MRTKDTPHFGADARPTDDDNQTTPFFEDLNKSSSMVDIQNGPYEKLNRLPSHAVTITEQAEQTQQNEEVKEECLAKSEETEQIEPPFSVLSKR